MQAGSSDPESMQEIIMKPIRQRTAFTVRDIICISNKTYEDIFFFFVVASTKSQL